MDNEFGFKADDKLVTQVIASLSYENFEPDENILRLDVVSSGIFFIYDGEVEVSYKLNEYVLLIYDQGSYIGDTSFIFQIRNQYQYKSKQGNAQTRIYSL